MSSKLRARLSFANVVSVIALFVALGGSSYAAIQVTGKNVKNSSLTGRDVKNSSLTSSDVKNRSLLSRDFKTGQLPTGPPGPQGPQGVKGDTGDAGISGLERVYISGVGTNSNSPKQTIATCPAGKVAISGGYDISGGKAGSGTSSLTNVVADVVLPSSPDLVPGSVLVEAWEEEATADTWGVDAIAMCATVSP